MYVHINECVGDFVCLQQMRSLLEKSIRSYGEKALTKKSSKTAKQLE